MRRHLIYCVVLTLPLASCASCEDESSSGWDLVDDIGVEAELDASDVRDADDATGPVDTDPDADARVDAWQPEPVLPEVPAEHALTDRTSLDVDRDGTLWLGYHSCEDRDCNTSMLRVLHRPIDGDWEGEDIREHEGIFGVSALTDPIVVFPDSLDDTYRAAMRHPNGDWDMHVFSVERSFTPGGDGFDVDNDGTSYYVTFAPEGTDQVELAQLDMSAAVSEWEERTSLSVNDPQAAMERGLRADPGEGLYLVNRDGDSGMYGVYRYDEDDDAWPQSVELEDYPNASVHSLIVTDDYEICLSSDEQGRLLVTCGSMFDLSQDVEHFPDQLASRHPSSIIEGDDGTLYVAFIPSGNEELRVARRGPDADDWQVETVYDGPAYGVSTAIDHSGDLVLAFYTCNEEERCSLQVLWETPE